jgi:ubiquinone/menaquinone biosynthesis C-methylase UbiE
MKAFRLEQSDPDFFYRMLASDTVKLLGEYAALRGKRVLDSGSGPGDLAEAFRDAGSEAVALDIDWEEMHCRKRDLESATQADGTKMPFGDDVFDVSCSSNVLEHVADPVAIIDELVRVTRPGGVVFAHYTVWFGPWGAHEISPWHYLGAERALSRYVAKHGSAPKNQLGKNLFKLGVGEMISASHQIEGADVVDIFPRYLPRWANPIVKVPGLRELLTWNLAIVLVVK